MEQHRGNAVHQGSTGMTSPGNGRVHGLRCDKRPPVRNGHDLECGGTLCRGLPRAETNRCRSSFGPKRQPLASMGHDLKHGTSWESCSVAMLTNAWPER